MQVMGSLTAAVDVAGSVAAPDSGSISNADSEI